MSINKRSLLGLITFFFTLIFVTINILFWIALSYNEKRQQDELLHRFLLAGKMLHHNDANDLDHLFVRISEMDPNHLSHDGSVLEELPFGTMIDYHGSTYFVHHRPPKPPEFHDRRFDHPHEHRDDPKEMPVLKNVKETSNLAFWSIAVAIDLLISAFYFYLVRKLLPLYRLKNAIQSFKEGDTALDVPITGDDEISEVTREFNHALEKIAAMKESRSLFLRNILHELKTPIMKGSLTAECIDPGEDQERLKRIFDRMEFLLDEFAKMERFSSGEWELNRREYRFVDLLDHACDILMCDRSHLDVAGEDSELIVHADFELFTIALKNLIDNALRYGSGKASLSIRPEGIEICNPGTPIPENKRDFSAPFNRAYENSSAGLGLGLYLSRSIFERHGFALEYRPHDGVNCFLIRFGSIR
ncbi:MAG: ArsS family sensor histidine kinase [Sulfuricurvum sp.]